MERKGKRRGLMVRVSPDVYAALNSLCERHGLSQSKAIERLIDWCATLDATEQTLLLGRLDERDRIGVAQMVLLRQADAGKVGAEFVRFLLGAVGAVKAVPAEAGSAAVSAGRSSPGGRR